MSIGKRLDSYIRSKNMTHDELSVKGEISRQTVFNIIHDKTMPSGDVLCRIHTLCSDLNLNWLISGHGEMLNKSTSRKFPNITIENKDKKVYVTDKGSGEEELNERVNSLLSRLDEKERIIKALEDTISIQKMFIDKLNNSD